MGEALSAFVGQGYSFSDSSCVRVYVGETLRNNRAVTQTHMQDGRSAMEIRRRKEGRERQEIAGGGAG